MKGGRQRGALLLAIFLLSTLLITVTLAKGGMAAPDSVPPGKPTLVSPENNAVENTFSITFTWTGVWWNSEWTRRRLIIINNSENPNDLKYHQVRADVTYNPDMQPDFDDLRFCDNDGVTELDYWIENYNSSENAVAWIKVPFIPARDNHLIYMYYGNPKVMSASNGDRTFLFFDNFQGREPDPHKWEILGGRPQITPLGELEIYDELDVEGVRSTPIKPWPYGTAIRTKMKVIRDGDVSGFAYTDGSNADIDRCGLIIGLDKSRDLCYYFRNRFTDHNVIERLDEEYHLYDIIRVDSDRAIMKKDGVVKEDRENRDYVSEKELFVHCASRLGQPTYFDWILVRVCTFPEPTTSMGEAETVTYHIQIDDEASFTSPVHENEALIDDFYPYTFSANGDYYWRVRARDNAGNWGEWADNFKLTINVPPGQPMLYSPANGMVDNDNTPIFELTCGSNADNHRLLIDASPPDWVDCAENILLGATDNSYTVTTPLADYNYSWKVIAINEAGENESDVWTFVVDTAPPPAPSLGIPENNAVDNLVVAEDFTWENLDPIENTTPVVYQILIDDNSDFSSPENDSGWQSDNSWTAVLQNGKWYWKVRARDNAGNAGNWSGVRNKTVDTVAPPAPSLGIPENNTVDNLAIEDFTWENLDPIENTTPVVYQIMIDDNSDFSSPENDSGWQSDNSWTAVLYDGKWYWKVRARDNAGNAGSWSGVRNKTVDTVAPPAPSLLEPENNAYEGDSTPTFRWTEPVVPENYILVIDNDSDFSSPAQTIADLTDNTYTLTTALSDDVYYWRVREIDHAGNPGAWADSFKLTVDTSAPSAPASLAASPSGWTSTNSFTVSWTNPSDLSGIAGAYYKLDPAPTSPTDGTYVAGAGLTSISGISVSGDGSHPVYIWLKDRAGNVNHDNRDSTTLYLDTTAPGITLSPTLATKMAVAGSSIGISGTVSDLTSIIIRVNGKVVPAMDSSFSHTANLRVGPNTITITAVDAVGNASSTSLRVTRTTAGAPAAQPAAPSEQVTNIIMVGAALGIALFAVALMKGR